jgi:hypothetical protein
MGLRSAELVERVGQILNRKRYKINPARDLRAPVEIRNSASQSVDGCFQTTLQMQSHDVIAFANLYVAWSLNVYVSRQPFIKSTA